MEPDAAWILVIIGATPEGSEADQKTLWGSVFPSNELLGFHVGVRKGVMAQHRRFIRRQLKQRRPLAVRQDGAMRHVSFAFQIWFRYL